MRPGTRSVHSGEEPDFASTGDVVVPIHLSATFARKEIDKPTKGLEYSRTGNPTRSALETRLASLENAKYGLAFSSGMAAEATLLFTVLKQGDHVVAGDVLYGGTRRLLETTFRKFGVETDYVDMRMPSEVKRAMGKDTRVVWLESPTNPLMQICDINSISRIAKERRAITVVDNTFASPYIQNPLGLGATVVVHSTTKYISGHSDVIGGALMMSDKKLHESVRYNQNAIGAVPSPFDCFMILRGSKTLQVRMERHSANAMKIAEYLEHHPKVSSVHYPGLKHHPEFSLGKRQMRMPGGMLSVELKGGLTAARAFLGKLKVFSLAESLGGVESLADHPGSMTHASVPEKERQRTGVRGGLVQLSVGIEDSRDLIEDIEQALR